MIEKHPYLRVLLLCLAPLFILAGCSGEANTARYQERALTEFQAGNYERAEIEYLNVLRLNPTNHVAIRDLGIMACEQGRLSRAFILLSRLKALDPDDVEGRLHLGLCLALSGASEARQEAAFVLDREPTNGRAMLLLVDSSVTTNDLADAQDRLDQLGAAAGEISDYHVAQGSLALRNRDLTAAANSFRQALSLNSESSEAHAAMGNLFAIQGDQQSAEAEFRVAAELAPPRSMHRVRYAEFKAAAGDTNAARQLLEEVTRQAPDYVPALQRQAEMALAAGELQRCQELLEQILRRGESNLSAILLLVELRVAEGERDKAIVELEKAIKQYPGLPPLHYRMALFSVGRNDLSGAVNSLDQALSLQPDYADAVMLLAEIKIRRGELGSAIAILESLLANRPDLSRLQMMLAAAYRVQGKLDEALEMCRRMASARPDDVQPVFLASLILRQQGKGNDARQSFERALELSPDFLPALQQLVSMDLADRQFDAAGNRVRQAMERHSEDPHLLILLARVYLAEDNQSDAEAALLKAIELSPDLQAAHEMLADIYVASDRYQNALKQFQEMASQNPEDSAVWSRIAYFQSAVSNYTAAKDAYEKVLASDPKSRSALNNLAMLNVEHLGDLDQAYELASRARTAYPNDPYIADTLGWVCYQQGDYRRALTLLQQSAEQLSEQPEVMFHLGMVRYMQGEEAAAKVALESALRLDHEAVWRGRAQACLEVIAIDPQSIDAQSVARLEAWLAERPREVPLLVRMAVIYEQQGLWDKAAAAYDASLKVNPDLVPSLVRLAQINSSELKKPEEALNLARKARNLSPRDPFVAHTLGMLAYQAADYTWACSLLQESAVKRPSDPEVQRDLAMAYLNIGRLDDAGRALRRALETGINPSDGETIELFLEMMSLLKNEGDPAAARLKAQSMLQNDPDNVPARMVLGLVAEKSGGHDLARRSYESVLEDSPRFVPAIRQMTIVLADRQLNDVEAYKLGVEARKYLPEDPELAYSFGIVVYRRGDYLLSAELLRQSLAADPDNASALFHLGLAQSHLKMREAAKRSLDRALELDPDHSLAYEAQQVLLGL